MNSPQTQASGRSQDEIRAWMVQKVVEIAEIPESEVDTSQPLTRYGADSATILEISLDLEEWLGHKIDADLMKERPSIDWLSEKLAAAA